jgi:guanylate kinase
MNKGVLYVVSAPSGCGKGTILETVLKNNKNIYYSVSATTRNPREGEVDGVNYFFHTREEFQKLIDNNGMLEYAVFCDNYYGTPRKQVEDKLHEGYDVILEIETNGAMQIKENFPDAVLIFILPPSFAELRRRLYKRRTESEEVIEKRLAEAKKEIEMAKNYDYIMVNGELEKAILDFEAIIKASKLINKKNLNKIEEVLKNA